MGITKSENSYLLLKSFSNYGIYVKLFTLNSGITFLAVTPDYEYPPYYLLILFLFFKLTIIRNIRKFTKSLLIGLYSFFTARYYFLRKIMICLNDLRREWNQHFWSFCFWLFWSATPPPIASAWAASGWTPASPPVRTSDS